MHAFLRFFVYLLCFSVGLAIIALLLFRDSLLEYAITYLNGLREGEGIWTILSLGILQVLIPLALTLRWLAVRRFARELSYMTANGRVSVNLQAIEEALTRAAINVPGVKHIVIRVYEDRIRRQVIIQAVLTLWDESNITGITNVCQQTLSQRFQELMPEQRTIQVQISVNRLREQRGSEFIHAVQQQQAGEEHEITPGLSVTAGEVNNAAGRTLLEQTKRKRSEDGEIRERPVTEYGYQDSDSNQYGRTEDAHTTSVTERGEVEDEMDKLYHGPQYAVPSDDDQAEVTGSALPVDE